MKANVGDEIVVDANVTGGPRREGEVMEGCDDGDVVRYIVRWDDGHETIFYPGSDAHVVRPGHARR